ncbi:MAG TPA: T9SS type A sorting domain-containing protein [Chitinophagaceae bacterium]|nr:T9SS type A sorting domain-containing protein [Chitinophagaceae bacterium]
MNKKMIVGLLLAGIAGTASARESRLLKKQPLKLPAHATTEQVLAYCAQLSTQLKTEISIGRSGAKTTAVQSRLIADVSIDIGPGISVIDSVRAYYSGARGGDLKSASIKFDSARIFSRSPSFTLDLAAVSRQSFDAAENIKTRSEQDWDAASSTFIDYSLSFSNYNTDNQVTVDSMLESDGTALQIKSKQITNYNTAKDISETIDQEWNGSGWDNISRNTYLYTAAKKPSQLYVQTWNGSGWDTGGRVTYTYDGSGRLSTELTEYQDLSTMTWSNSSLTTYTYDAAGNKRSENRQQWDFGASSWKDYQYYDNHFDAGNKLIESIMSFTIGGTVDTFNHTVYKYNTYNQVTEEWTNPWDGSLHSWDEDNGYASRYYYEEYSPTTLKETAVQGSMRLFPVPAKDKLQLEVSLLQTQECSIILTDLQGRILQSNAYAAGSVLNETIPVSHLAPGPYLITISGAKGAHLVKQVIIAH